MLDQYLFVRINIYAESDSHLCLFSSKYFLLLSTVIATTSYTTYGLINFPMEQNNDQCLLKHNLFAYIVSQWIIFKK